MKKLKVLSVFGTRPEAVKMCPLVCELQKRAEIESYVLVTAQHRELLDDVTCFFDVKADYDLNLMKPGQTLSTITSGVLCGVGDVIKQMEADGRKPDIVLVHGDTTTSFAAALASFYEKVPVGHVEAGLRSFDRYSPFPEEMNRLMTGRIADYHFSPTKNNVKNLEAEGITENVFVTGNTGLDALRYTIKPDYTFENETLRDSKLFESEKLIVLTAHRRENIISGGLDSIARAVKRIAEEFPNVRIIDPMHPNPAVRNALVPILGDLKNVTLIDPVGVADMHNLLSRADLCLTDSGGLQEEAPALGLPVLVLRNETERPEAAEAGTVKVIGVEEDTIYSETKTLLTDKAAYEKMANAVNPYGDGHSSEKIADILCEVARNR